MPQLSLTIDEDIMHRIENGAKNNKTSVSVYVTAALREYFSKNWSDNLRESFGSITDESFVCPDDIPFALNAKGEDWIN